MRLNTTNIVMLLIGILLLLSAYYKKPFLDVAKELIKDGKIAPNVAVQPLTTRSTKYRRWMMPET